MGLATLNDCLREWNFPYMIVGARETKAHINRPRQKILDYRTRCLMAMVKKNILSLFLGQCMILHQYLFAGVRISAWTELGVNKNPPPDRPRRE
jgi:hypothetical protein